MCNRNLVMTWSKRVKRELPQTPARLTTVRLVTPKARQSGKDEHAHEGVCQPEYKFASCGLALHNREIYELQLTYYYCEFFLPNLHNGSPNHMERVFVTQTSLIIQHVHFSGRQTADVVLFFSCLAWCRLQFFRRTLRGA